MLLLPWVTLPRPLHLTGVIAAARQCCADHLKEAQLLFAHCSVGLELSRSEKAIDGKVLWLRREELTSYAHDIHQISYKPEDF